MNCHYCGSALRDGEIFCHCCGTRLPRAPKKAPAAVAPQPCAPVYEEPAQTPEEKEFPVISAPVYTEKTFGWQPYGAPAKEEPLVDIQEPAFTGKPKLQLPTKRSLLKMILFGILTLGIYPIVIWSRLTGEVNLVASRYDGERSVSFFGMLMLAPLTLGIHSLVWSHNLCRRMGNELQRRGVDYKFSAKDFWIWAFLMGLLSSISIGVCGVLAYMGFDLYIVLWLVLALGIFTLAGPFVFVAKLTKASNLLNADYNIHG